MTTTLKDEVLELMRGGSIDYDPAGNLFALTTDVPNDETYTKVSGFGYVDVTTTLTDWSPPVNRKGQNATELIFPEVANPLAPEAVAYVVKGAVVERFTTGEALYTQGVTSGYSYRHGDEAYFPVGNADLTFNFAPLRLGTDLINAVYNATLRGQTLNAVGTFNLRFTANKPQAGVIDTVLSIPLIELPSDTATWTAPALASTLLSAPELEKYGIDPNARAITNAVELRTEVLTQDYTNVGGVQIVTPTDELWWRTELTPAKYVYEDSQLKILPNTLVLAI